MIYTIKRILKSLSMTWHRVRKTVFGEPDPNEYREKVEQLADRYTINNTDEQRRR